jgi:hypothetical protein
MSKAYLGDELLYDSALFAPRTSLWLPGTSGNYASAPYVAAMAPGSDDFEIEFVAIINWSGSLSVLAGRSVASGSNQVWRLAVTGGILLLYVSTDGIDVTALQTTIPLTFGSSLGAVKCEYEANVGGITRCHFSTSADAGNTWVLHETITSDLIGALYASTAANLEIGSRNNGATNALVGSVHRMKHIIGGTVVASPDFTSPASTRFLDAQDNLWTINGSAWAWEKA